MYLFMDMHLLNMYSLFAAHVSWNLLLVYKQNQ